MLEGPQRWKPKQKQKGSYSSSSRDKDFLDIQYISSDLYSIAFNLRGSLGYDHGAGQGELLGRPSYSLADRSGSGF